MTEIPPPPPPVPTPPPAFGAPVPSGGKGLAITSLITGIAAIALCCYWFIAIPAGVAAVITGILAMQRGQSKGMAIAGLITGGLGVLLGLVLAILTFTGGLDDYCSSNAGNVYCENV